MQRVFLVNNLSLTHTTHYHAINGLIQEVWADSNIGHSKLSPKEDEDIINLIQTIEG